nr:MAG TPA: acetyl xylan esterase [Caudoviricetes sp.]
METRVLAVPGTWEKPGGLLEGVTSNLDPAHFTVTWIHYPATFALPMSYEESKKVAVERLREEWARDTKAPIVLLGYSQGADAVGDFAREVAGHPRLKVVALVADPWKPRGPGIGGAKLLGHGVCGERHIPGAHVLHCAIPGDVVCDAHPSSLWRLTADLTQSASLDLPRWGVAVLKTVLDPRVQLLDDTPTSQRLWGALSTIPELWRYVGGAHTAYARRRVPRGGRTYTQELARLIAHAADR